MFETKLEKFIGLGIGMAAWGVALLLGSMAFLLLTKETLK